MDLTLAMELFSGKQEWMDPRRLYTCKGMAEVGLMERSPVLFSNIIDRLTLCCHSTL